MIDGFGVARWIAVRVIVPAGLALSAVLAAAAWALSLAGGGGLP